MHFMVLINPQDYPYPRMGETARILIVDDDVEQAEMLREFLRISGFDNIDHVVSLYSLWERLKSQEYDILILDYRLPDGTGLDALDQLHARGNDLPVLMLTGQGSERIAAQAIQRGAAEYLIKTGDYLITIPAQITKTIHAHQLQLSVRRSLEQIRYQATLLNNVRDAIVVWDMEGRITYWNPAASQLFGWSAEERLGRPVAQYYLNTFTPSIKPPKEGDSVGQHIVRKTTNRDGKIVWVSSRVTPLHDVQVSNRPIGYMDVSNDITRRLEAEQALRESEARYRAIVEDYQTELICRFKPNGTLTFVNEVFCQYFDKTREELLGMNFLFFVPEAERQTMIHHLTSFTPERSVETLEHQVDIPDHGLRWLQRTDRAIFDNQGRVFEFQSMQRDITDRKMMESQIQAAQAHLVQAARLTTIGEIASGVAHQIYNPLTTIIADAQILQRSLNTEQDGRDSAEAIEQAGWRLQQVVQRLMEFSQPAADTLTLLDLNETIQSVLSLVGTHIESIGIQLESQLADGLPAVRGNRRQLENVWINLLLLARDACANGRGHKFCIQSKVEGPDEMMVEVRDDGQPIPADQLATIFEPNFIGPTIGRGTGLELSICREIIRQHGGQITAESAPDHDTIFRVTLPTVPGTEAEV